MCKLELMVGISAGILVIPSESTLVNKNHTNSVYFTSSSNMLDNYMDFTSTRGNKNASSLD